MTLSTLLDRFLKRFFPPKPIELDPTKGTDDYDWRYYHLDYRAQIADIEKTTLLRLSKENHSVVGGAIVTSDTMRLHPNHQCLYETILALNPKSAIEIGCGGGDHLHNLGILMPQLHRTGFDRSKKQLEFLKTRSPHLSNLVSILDVTARLPPVTADLVYTQAVIMHIQAPGAHLKALEHIFKSATKHVVLMENWRRHHFVSDILALHERGLIWKPHFHIRRYGNRPHLLVISKEALQFEPLQSYEQLLEGMQ